MKWTSLVAAIAVLATVQAIENAAAQNSGLRPSFDCSKATSASARLICSDAELSKADGVLGAKFKTAVAGKDGSAKKQLVAEQLTWLRERNNRCGLGPDKARVPVDQLIGAKPCMKQAIEERIALLSSRALTTEPIVQKTIECTNSSFPGIFILVDPNSVDKSTFQNQQSIFNFLNKLRDTGLITCQRNQANSATSVVVGRQDSFGLNNQFRADQNGLNNWIIRVDNITPQLQREEAKRVEQLRLQEQQRRQIATVQSCTHDPTTPDIMCIRPGMRPADLPNEFKTLSILPSENVPGAYEARKCFPSGETNAAGNQINSCLFIFFTGSSSERIVYEVSIIDLKLGTFRFSQNAIAILTQRFGPYTSQSDISAFYRAWGTSSDFYSQTPIVEIGDIAVFNFVHGLTFYKRFPNLKRIVLARVSQNYGQNNGGFFADISLLDVPMAYNNQQQFIAEKARRDEEARERELQQQGPSKF